MQLNAASWPRSEDQINEAKKAMTQIKAMCLKLLLFMQQRWWI